MAFPKVKPLQTKNRKCFDARLLNTKCFANLKQHKSRKFLFRGEFDMLCQMFLTRVGTLNIAIFIKSYTYFRY